MSAQSVVQSVNSGSIITASSSVSVGEIVVVPVDPAQPHSGIIGIMAQVNNLQLEVDELELSPSIKVFPNPTVSSISFEGQDLSGEKVTIVGSNGQIISQTMVSSANSIDLSTLAAGIYLIKFDNNQINTFKIVKH